MSMADFNKRLIEVENKVTSHTDEVNKKLTDFQNKFNGHADNMKRLQDTTNRIEIQMEQRHIQSEVNQNETLTLLNLVCKKINIIPEQLLQEDEGNQEHNSSDSTKSTDSQKVESPKKSATPHQENSNAIFSNKQLWDTFTNQHPFFAQPLVAYQ